MTRGRMGVVVLMLAVFAPVALHGATIQTCPPYDTLDKTVYLPHPYDCSLFRRCQAGQPVLGHCSLGQHFNPATSACDDPARSGCTATPNTCSSKKPSSTCRYKCQCDRYQSNPMCPSKLQFGAEFNIVDLQLHPGCDKEPSNFELRNQKLGVLVVRNATAMVSMCSGKGNEMYAPHFANCAVGIRCDNGKEEQLKCPPGYFYDTNMGYCDEPQYVNCTSAAAVTSSGCSSNEALSTCHHTCSCEAQQGNCPSKLMFSATVNVFDAVKQPACLKGTAVIGLGDQYAGTLDIHPNTTRVNHCPNSKQTSPIYIPDPSNCGSSLLCFRGVERRIFCPINLNFNPKTNKCGKPDPAICKTTAPPTPAPSSPPVAVDDLTCPSAVNCPAGTDSKIPHLTDCTLYCQCTQGKSTLAVCPPGLHFNSQIQTCDSPNKANCKTFCKSLVSAGGGTWSPQSCTIGDSAEGTECKLTCDSKTQLLGSEFIKCTNKGWHGTGGLNVLPTCNSPAQVAVNIINKLNNTMNQIAQTGDDAGMLFILDESGSVGATNFEIEKDFVAAIVNAFPLSHKRSAGVMTFQDNAAIDISLTETSTCNFLSKLRSIYYASGGTDIANALRVAQTQINQYYTSKTTLVFLITDGQSQTDPVAAAQMLRNYNRILFTIGVAGYDRKQLEPISSIYKDGSPLFFGLPNFEVFRVVAEYLKDTYNNGATIRCP